MANEASVAAPERARWPRLAMAPHPALRPLVPRGYAGFTEATAPRHLVLPATTSVPLIVKIRESAYRPPAFVMGVHGAYSVIEGDCAPSYLEVWLAPLGAYTLLGLPMDALRGQTVDLTDLLGAAGRRLAERLPEVPTWRRRFALVDELLLRRLERGPRPSPEVGRAWRRLVATGGAAPIGQLADEVGWSHRHLITRFKQQIGLPPKTAARLIRLDGVWRRLDARLEPPRVSLSNKPRALDWGQVAADAGYADQAHLIRDFRQFTGATPTGFLARTLAARPAGSGEVKSVQDAAAAAS
jgi:AraC-like DNA-binding protein